MAPRGATSGGGCPVAPIASLLPAADDVADPFPIRRVRVTEEQLPDAIKGLDAGVLVRLPRDEFEARVRKAGRVAAEARITPRVAEASYTATLTGDDLTGTAEWVVVNPCGRPAALTLARDRAWAN